MVSYHFRMTCLDLVPINPQPLNGFVRLATCSILFFPGSFHFRIKWLQVCHMVQNNPTTILMTLDWKWRNRNCTLGYCMPNGWGICATGWRPAYLEAAFLMHWELHMLRFTNRCKLLGQCWTQRFAWNLPNSTVKKTRISSIAGSFFF